jgi:kynurenine formamidase
MPVYPGDDKTSLKASRFLAEDGYNDDRLEISMHAGTHVDGPRHLTASRQLSPIYSHSLYWRRLLAGRPRTAEY